MSVSTTYLNPGNFITTDNSKANTLTSGPFITVLIGQRTSAGTVAAEVLTSVFSASDAGTKFGVGSMVHEMVKEWYVKNTVSQLKVIALDDAAGTAGTQTLTVTGTATAAGTVFMYVNGTLFRVGVASGDTPTVIGDAIAAAINADVDLPCTAANVTGTVTCTAKNKGTIGNDIDYRFNYDVNNEAFPAAVSVAVATGVTGATDPDVADAIAVLPDEVYKMIVTPYTDTSNLALFDTEFTRRWEPTVKLYGFALSAYTGTASAVATWGDTKNDQYLTVMDNGKSTMMPAYLRAATTGSQVALNAENDPSLKFSNLEITGDGDVEADRRNKTAKNTLLNSGIGTHKITADGTVYIDRLVTTYKTNVNGSPDNSYRNLNTITQLQDFNLGWETKADSLYARGKLAHDGTTFGSAAGAISNESSIAADLVGYYEDLVTLGRVEDSDTFAESVTVTIDTSLGRATIKCSPKFVGQFYQTDTTVTFLI